VRQQPVGAQAFKGGKLLDTVFPDSSTRDHEGRYPMKTVLVVDDSDLVLEVVKKNLENAGYRVITRNKPSGSVAAILRDRPDVVLLDVNMPTLAGDTIANILSRVTQNQETLVLLHSSLSIDHLRSKALAAGAHGYIQKTESPTELVRRIEYWLNRSRRAVSSSKLQAAPSTGATAPSSGATSSGRLAAAPPAGASTGAASSTSSSSLAAAPPQGAATGRASASSSSRLAATPAAPARSSSSSSRWRAAPPVTAQPHTPAAGGAPAGARAAASSGVLRSPPTKTETSSPSGSGTPTSRNMRAAKPFMGGDRPKVLFVDDDWKMLSSYRTMVAGYLDADFVSSSDDAFNRILSDSPPQVIVCDIVMPGLSGADIYRRAVLLDPRWANRFVFVTGAASTPSVAEFLNTLDVRVFHKPVPTDRLLDTLKQMTEALRR
jgi:two-component system, OmpR family, response regulator